MFTAFSEWTIVQQYYNFIGWALSKSERESEIFLSSLFLVDAKSKLRRFYIW